MMPRTFPAAPGRSLRKWLSLLVVGLALNLAAVRAAPKKGSDPRFSGPDEAGRKTDLPAVFDKVAPENLDDLRAMQNQVRHVLEKVVPCTVSVQVGGSSGSGVIVDAEGLVLTAGHVSGKPGQDCVLIFPDGKRAKGKTLGQNKGIDSGMIKIVDEAKEGTWPFIEMGSSANLKKG